MTRFKACKNPACNHLIEADSRKIYCQNSCRQKAYRDRKKVAPKPPIQLEIAICAFCDQPFQKRRPNHRCCKPAHRQALYRELKKLADVEDIA